MRPKNMTDHLEQAKIKLQQGGPLGATEKARLKARGLMRRSDGSIRRGMLGKSAEAGEYDDSHMLSKILERMSAQSQHLKDKIDSGLQIPSWAEYKLYNAYDSLGKALGTAYPGNYQDKEASVEYRGKTFPGYNQPINSDKKDKKKMVLVRKGDKVKVVHYGQKGYQHNYSDQAKENYLTRSAGIRNKSGQLTKDDPFSPNHWARKDLWPSKEPADGKALSGIQKKAAEGYGSPQQYVHSAIFSFRDLFRLANRDAKRLAKKHLLARKEKLREGGLAAGTGLSGTQKTANEARYEFSPGELWLGDPRDYHDMDAEEAAELTRRQKKRKAVTGAATGALIGGIAGGELSDVLVGGALGGGIGYLGGELDHQRYKGRAERKRRQKIVKKASLTGTSARYGAVLHVPRAVRAKVFRAIQQALSEKPITIKNLTAKLQTQFPGITNIRPFLKFLYEKKAIKITNAGISKAAAFVKEALMMPKFKPSSILPGDFTRRTAERLANLNKTPSVPTTNIVRPANPIAGGAVSDSQARLEAIMSKYNENMANLRNLYNKTASSVATKTDPAKWEAAKREAKAKMGGKHSARAMQLATKIYKDNGGGYSGAKPTSSNNSLTKWTKQKWTTPSGARSQDTGEVYLPSRRIKHLMKSESGRKGLTMATAIKQDGYSKGQQYTSHGLASGTSLKKEAYVPGLAGSSHKIMMTERDKELLKRFNKVNPFAQRLHSEVKTASVVDIIDSAKNFDGLRGTNWGK